MFCTSCGKFFEGNSDICPDCEAANGFAAPVQEAVVEPVAEEEAPKSFAEEMRDIAKKLNILSIISFVCSFICCCCIPGIASMVTGIMCLVNLKKVPSVDPSTLNDEDHAAYDSAKSTKTRAMIFSIIGMVLSVPSAIIGIFALLYLIYAVCVMIFGATAMAGVGIFEMFDTPSYYYY